MALLPNHLSTGLDIGSWTLGKVTLWLTEHNFSRDWITTFIVLNIQGLAFLELGSGHGGRGNFGMMHQQIYPRLAEECSNSGTGWDQAREREEGKRMRRSIRAIVAGRSMVLPSSDTDQQLVSASITSYNDLQFPESFVSTP
jgi:mitogen-activated protein kinase kinase kinase